MTEPRHPITDPLDLLPEYQARYEQVRILRRFIDPTGETPVQIDGPVVRKGHHRPFKPISTDFVDAEQERKSHRKPRERREAMARQSIKNDANTPRRGQ